MKEPGGPFQRCLATCARERAASEAEEKEAKKFEEYLYANVNLETGEMLAPEEAPSLLKSSCPLSLCPPLCLSRDVESRCVQQPILANSLSPFLI